MTIKISFGEISDPSIRTTKGMRFDNRKVEVIQAYGNDYYIRKEHGVTILGYYERPNLRTLEFWIYKDKVISVGLSIEQYNGQSFKE